MNGPSSSSAASTPHGVHVRLSGFPVALESTLLLHGVPADAAMPLHQQLCEIVSARGATPALVAVLDGTPVVGVSDAELAALLAAPKVVKANASNLGIVLHRRMNAATTVSVTMELAAAAGVRVFATGGIGGAHRGYGESWDVSSDLAALARYPVAVIASGTKSILDVPSTREMLETLGVPVVGFRTDRFPAFYLRESEATVDARFDDEADLAAYIGAELRRTGRGVLVANPIPEADQIQPGMWQHWLDQAEALCSDVTGRDVTPRLLARLHEVSSGKTLSANIALVKSNAALAAGIARLLGHQPKTDPAVPV
ncbi:MAG: Pseudouridine-5'-phosphate glycosidase [Phycisphaerales bacterium]|nr:Pseudouridine-5'-phosphate glycosidase [Phycisphaerales bacterium]